MNRDELLDTLRDLRAGPLPNTPDWLLEHGLHRDSDDPDTWRRNKDLRVPANTEGPGLSFEEAVDAALRKDAEAEAERLRECLTYAERKISDDREQRWTMRRHLDAASDLLRQYEDSLVEKTDEHIADDSAWSEEVATQRERAERAEAEAERLRAALQRIEGDRLDEGYGITVERATAESRVRMREIARAALSGGDTG